MNILAPLFTHKYLLFQLTQREIKARYKQSFIGYFWVVLNPLVQMLVYTFVFSVVIRFETPIPYPLFLFAALLPWTLFHTSITRATQSLVENSVLLKKVAFPREIIPYAVILSKVIDFIFSSAIFIVMMFIYQVPLTVATLLFIPLFILQLILTTGISLMLSTFNLFYRDIQYLANLLLMVWMYMSPIIYPLKMIPEKYKLIYSLNPMVGILEGYRWALFGTPVETNMVIWSIFSSVVIFFVGFIIFKRSEKVFADIV